VKVAHVVGARPQFIKLAPVSAALEKRGVSQIVVHTGQHFDNAMSSVFFEELEMAVPQHNLGIHSLSHGAMTGRMLEALERVLKEESPDATLVYGDTDSTLAGALAASKLGIYCAHVEAGLRSFNRAMPEELNRVAADHLSDALLAPTETAMRNLAAEGLSSRSRLVGDVMYDALLRYSERAGKTDFVKRLGFKSGGFFLATLHRAGATDDAQVLNGVLSALEEISQTRLPVLMPMHPRTRAAVIRAGIRVDHIRVVDPVSYLEMVALLNASAAVLTDSGGLQKEAYFARKICFTLRAETEWVETVKMKANILCGVERQDIVSQVDLLSDHLRTSVFGLDFYGSGNAAESVVECLFSRQPRMPVKGTG